MASFPLTLYQNQGFNLPKPIQTTHLTGSLTVAHILAGQGHSYSSPVASLPLPPPSRSSKCRRSWKVRAWQKLAIGARGREWLRMTPPKKKSIYIYIYIYVWKKHIYIYICKKRHSRLGFLSGNPLARFIPTRKEQAVRFRSQSRASLCVFLPTGTTCHALELGFSPFSGGGIPSRHQYHLGGGMI